MGDSTLILHRNAFFGCKWKDIFFGCKWKDIFFGCQELYKFEAEKWNFKPVKFGVAVLQAHNKCENCYYLTQVYQENVKKNCLNIRG
ncbi:hypothetical protein SUGI_0030560 [Cryptomeria japonica]|nr:hypothetical protein SUGI_0030560 [Cryptomeria japonica]